MKRIGFTVLAIALAVGCSRSSNPVSPAEFVVPLTVQDVKGDPLASTHLGGEHEIPARPTLAQGQAILKVLPDGESISYKVIASNIDNVVQSHIHVGPPDQNGPVVVFLFGPVASGGGRHDGVLAEGTFTKANFIGPLMNQPFSALIAQMQAGNTYVNVHTNDGVGVPNTGPGDFPGGEIRGQVRTKGQ
jgi:hypothetical protein